MLSKPQARELTGSRTWYYRHPCPMLAVSLTPTVLLTCLVARAEYLV